MTNETMFKTHKQQRREFAADDLIWARKFTRKADKETNVNLKAMYFEMACGRYRRYVKWKTLAEKMQ